MAFFSNDWFDFEDNDDEWWDEYAHYQDEKDAFWASYYSKIYHNLPDSVSIFKVNQTRNYYHSNQLSPDEVVTYEMLHAVICKTELLFSLWQKRLSHEWNKDIKVPWNNNEEEKSSDLIKDDKQNENIANENGGHGSEGKEIAVVKEDTNHVDENHRHPFCPHIAMAVDVLEEYGMLHELLSPLFSDEEDSYGYYDSDDWLSLDGEPDDYSDEEEIFAHQLRISARKEARKAKEKSETNESIARYQECAKKFYRAFPQSEEVDETVNNLITLKNWINNLFIFILSKSIGRQLPELVMEKILQYLLNSHGELQIKIGYIAKTQKFIDVEKLRLRELYAAILEIHAMFFEILFKNQLVSNTFTLHEHIKKLFQNALRKLSMVEELNSWLLNEDSSFEGSKGFLSGIYYCKLIKASGRDFDYLQPLNEAFTSFDGRHLAILVPGAIKESIVKIYDVRTFKCVALHSITPKGIASLGVALNKNELALMLKKDGSCWVEIRDLLGYAGRKLVKLTLGATKKESIRKMLFIEFGELRKLLLQKDDDIVVIDVSLDRGIMALSVEKTYHQLELLAAKSQYMITRDFVKSFTTAKEVTENSKPITGIKVFDVKSHVLLRVISNSNDDQSGCGAFWSAAMDTDPHGTNFMLWKDSKLQLWKIDGHVKKVKDIDLGSRVSTGTKIVFNKDIIAVQSVQTSHDSNFDKVDLTEISFHEIPTGKTYFHELYHSFYEKPETHIATAGGHIYGMHMTDDMIISLHSSTSGGQMRICNFGLSPERIMGLQVRDLMEKRREEELKRQIKEAERKRLNEERMKKKEEQRLKRLDKKLKQRQAQQKRRQQIDNLKNAIATGAYVTGEVSEWRGSYGFLEVEGMGSAFIHITDIKGKPRITAGCRIHCKLKEQMGHTRPKAVGASLIHC